MHSADSWPRCDSRRARERQRRPVGRRSSCSLKNFSNQISKMFGGEFALWNSFVVRRCSPLSRRVFCMLYFACFTTLCSTLLGVFFFLFLISKDINFLLICVNIIDRSSGFDTYIQPAFFLSLASDSFLSHSVLFSLFIFFIFTFSFLQISFSTNAKPNFRSRHNGRRTPFRNPSSFRPESARMALDFSSTFMSFKCNIFASLHSENCISPHGISLAHRASFPLSPILLICLCFLSLSFLFSLTRDLPFSTLSSIVPGSAGEKCIHSILTFHSLRFRRTGNFHLPRFYLPCSLSSNCLFTFPFLF